MRIALSVATALLLAAMTVQASAQADPHHPEGTGAAPTETTTGAAGCPAQGNETMGGMPRPEIGSSSPMEMMRMMEMMQQMQMMQMQMMQMQLTQQMRKGSE
jgi:hypothetical protein